MELNSNGNLNSHQFYVMDGMQTLAVLDQNGLSHFNIVGNGTEGRVSLDGSNLTTRRYYLKDHLGSTREVISATGATLETFDYYPFGLLMPRRNTTDAGTLEQFTGKERDTEADLNLDYFGARYYDASIGRWNGVDPLADNFPEWSAYNYTFNNPMIFIDPDGNSPCKEGDPCEETDVLNDMTAYFQNLFDNGKEFINDAPDQISNSASEIANDVPALASEVAETAKGDFRIVNNAVEKGAEESRTIAATTGVVLTLATIPTRGRTASSAINMFKLAFRTQIVETASTAIQVTTGDATLKDLKNKSIKLGLDAVIARAGDFAAARVVYSKGLNHMENTVKAAADATEVVIPTLIGR